MQTVPVTDFRANLADYLNQVRRGQTLTITARNTPIAKLQPASPTTPDPSTNNQVWINNIVQNAPPVNPSTPTNLASNLDAYLYGR